MKKIKYFLLFVIMFFIAGVNVDAANISLDKFVSVINNGEVTKEFENSFGKDSVVFVSATKTSDISISLYYDITIPVVEKGKVTSYEHDTATVDFYYDNTTNMLTGERTFDTKSDVQVNPYLVKVLKLVPYWAVESSSKFENIKGYLGNEKIITTFEKIFDKCYLDKMGVCYTEITEYTNVTYRAKVELSDKGANYAIDYFKEVEVQKDEDEFMGFMFKILIVLVGLVVIVCLLRGIILSITKN